MKAETVYLENKKFRTKARNFEINTDLPPSRGGDDSAPTPSELLMTGLGACTGYFVTTYLNNAGIPADGLSVDLNWEFSEKPRRISKISINIKNPNGEIGKRKMAAIKAAQYCTVHNTLSSKPEISITIDE